MSQPLILASTSPYRAELLGRLGLPFEAVTPGVAEDRLPGEALEAMVARLAETKARTVAAFRPGAAVVGSDQCAVLDGEPFGKPGDFETAWHQLRRASGRSVTFLTALCVLAPGGDPATVEVVPFTVTFRELDDDRIARYISRDRPYQCAGSIRAESLGPALFERMEGADPTALLGLPLIRTVRLLEEVGLSVL